MDNLIQAIFPVPMKHLKFASESIVIARDRAISININKERDIIDEKIYPLWNTYYVFNGVITIRYNDYELFNR